MREIRNRPQDGVRLFDDPLQLRLDRSGQFAQPAPFGLAGFALGGVLRLADRLAHVVGLAVQLIEFGLLGLAIGLEGDELIDVGLRAAVGAVLFDQFDVFDNESAIEHARANA